MADKPFKGPGQWLRQANEAQQKEGSAKGEVKKTTEPPPKKPAPKK